MQTFSAIPQFITTGSIGIKVLPSSVSDFDNTLLNQNGEAILDGIGSCGRFFDFRPGVDPKVPRLWSVSLTRGSVIDAD